MDSNAIKHYLHYYYRFNRQYDYVATEVDLGLPYLGYGNIADLAVCNDKELIEIEVKTSIKDFKADFVKNKHAIYKGEIKDLPTSYTKGKYNYIVPNKFYFALSNELYLKERGTIEIILQDFVGYGLIILLGDRHYVNRRATLIHKLKPESFVYNRIARRSSAEAYVLRDKSL